MQETLKELNQEIDLIGSMVITTDGIMVAAAVGAEYEEDAVAAFAASLVMSLKRGLAPFDKGDELKICIVGASKGKVAFLDMQNSYLVLFARPEFEFDDSMQEIQRAIYSIKHRRVA